MKLHIYDNMLSTFFACTSRQITFSKFEYMANEIINAGKPFTVETVKELSEKARDQYEGITKASKALNKKYPYNLASTSILRVPHFYMNSFYVYKYAIGQILAIVIANEIYSGNKTMTKNYIEFLKAGCSIPPLDIIKIVGLDLHKPEVYAKAKKIVTKLVKEFIKCK